MIASLMIASHVILPVQAPADVPLPEPIAVMTSVYVEEAPKVEAAKPAPAPTDLPEVEDEDPYAWPTTGVVQFEDGSWRNMDTGESGCNPGGLCELPNAIECGPGLVLAEDESCVPESFYDDMPERYAPTFGYGPCEFEDSNGCFWDAAARGNGQGDSFVVHPDGTVIYWED